jgi:5-methylcytosine-specific restriction endonuclease McrA
MMPPEPVSPEWLRAEIERMHAERLAGKFPVSRESILARLGYRDYESYLSSPPWRRIHCRILKRDERLCVRCGDKATQVHHKSYTEPVLRGEDDSQLVSICEPCHNKVELTDTSPQVRRTEAEKRRVLEDRDGARQEKQAREEKTARASVAAEHRERVRAAAGGRCFWCKGNTELWPGDGKVYETPTGVDVWLCLACWQQNLRRKANVRYTRPAPGLGTKAFLKFNAMQREGIINEHNWLIKEPNLETTKPERFAELKARYESTRCNGRDRRTR